MSRGSGSPSSPTASGPASRAPRRSTTRSPGPPCGCASDGLDDVRLEPVDVPHWVRGQEHARIVRPVRRSLTVLALGGSVGTNGTLHAPMVAFESLDELKSSPARLDGTIAFVNHRMPPFDDEHDDPGYRVGRPGAPPRRVRGREARRPRRRRPLRDGGEPRRCRTPARSPTTTACRRSRPLRSRPRTPTSSPSWPVADRSRSSYRSARERCRMPRAPTSSASCVGGSVRTRSCCSARTSIRGTWARARPTMARDASR